MLALGTEVITDARSAARAVIGFSTYTLESTRAICTAAETTGRAVLIQVSTGAFAASSFEMLVGAVLAAARACAVPIGVHLDHSRDLDEIRACLDAGFTSVMVDGSHLDFADNIAFSRAAADAAHRAGAWIEAELGPVAGDEHASGATGPGALTDPDQAAEFVTAVGADVLAGAVGTIHGRATATAELDTERIAAITAASGVPFALHGASGLSHGELRAAVRAGAAKINVNTELRLAYREAVREATSGTGDDVTVVMRAAREAMTVAACRVIAACESDGELDRKDAT